MDFEPTFLELFKVILALLIFNSALSFSLEQFKINAVCKFLRALQFVSDQSSRMQRMK